MITFGVGKLFGIPTDPTLSPVEFGLLQNVSVGLTWDKKELYGSLQFPARVVRGKGKIDCKAAFAQINSLGFNVLIGGTAVAGQNLVTSVATVVPSTPFTVTTTANQVDMGVWDNSNPLYSVPMTRVASAPATGQYMYTVATGIYTFAAVDVAKKIQYSQMNDAGTGGQTIAIPNMALGVAPTFKAVLSGQLDTGKAMTIALNCCMTTKFDFAFKQDDFVIPQFDFSAFADSSGSPGEITLAE